MGIRAQATFLMVMAAGSCAAAPVPRPTSAPPAYAVRAIALPGARGGAVHMDYLLYDPAHHRVWVPAGNTGSVDVIDVAGDRVTRIGGFPTTEVTWHGAKHTVGPSSATVGTNFAWVGNRGDSTVCAIDEASLHRGACLRLDSMPDGLAYVGVTKEVWVTTPRDDSITILDARVEDHLTHKATIHPGGRPEAFAVDDGRGIFYTNLEDKDRTLGIDIKSRKVVTTWSPGCGDGGPKGLGLDRERNVLFVACPDHVVAFDAGHGGKRLGEIGAGAGIDNIDYVESRHELYVAAARAATLTIARLEPSGALTRVAVVPTAAGARNAVATDKGVAYVTDSAAGKILVVSPARSGGRDSD